MILLLKQSGTNVCKCCIIKLRAANNSSSLETHTCQMTAAAGNFSFASIMEIYISDRSQSLIAALVWFKMILCSCDCCLLDDPGCEISWSLLCCHTHCPHTPHLDLATQD